LDHPAKNWPAYRTGGHFPRSAMAAMAGDGAAR